MVNSYVGIDSTTFYHEGLTRFKAPLGVAIEVENFEEFDEKYSIIMKELKKKRLHHQMMMTLLLFSKNVLLKARLQKNNMRI